MTRTVSVLGLTAVLSAPAGAPVGVLGFDPHSTAKNPIEAIRKKIKKRFMSIIFWYVKSRKFHSEAGYFLAERVLIKFTKPHLCSSENTFL
jgi:transposase